MLGLALSSSNALEMVAIATGMIAPHSAQQPPPVRIVEPYSPEQCNLPPVPHNARLVVFSVNDGEAISSAVIGNQDVVTDLIDVNIEAGSEPLYLVLTSSSSMIWRLSGAKGRVVRVVVSSATGDRREAAVPQVDWVPLPPPITSQRYIPNVKPQSLSGVIGLPRRKVSVAYTNCPTYFRDLTDGQDEKARQFIFRHFGRIPDTLAANYSVRDVSLPSGKMAASQLAAMPPGFDSKTWLDAIRFWRGGLVHVNPATVAAAVPVERYLVLPSQMGLSQLVGAQAVQRERFGAFRVIRPIAHMPPGMGGAHSVLLTFAEGVPVAPGSSGHSCIVQEATGERRGARCGIGDR